MNKGEPIRYQSFKEFYPFYLSQHKDPICRNLHYLGSILVLLIFFVSIFSGNYQLLILLPIVGYGCAWVGHFMFEKNRPATFQYPLYSFMADWVMLVQGVLQVFKR
ncbi:putative membrane protein [Shewanella psychrophila]|uniref:Putative membrane protein n=1 Tax=Shewanella psychrophila TaxID=225848 RepID=A0A1S6HP59_9GAMM|nr:DUF962 domain-containing protein [Shewanella psychrophila]AQS37307.1 putative membrane protein [Shewanella psychrophila]